MPVAGAGANEKTSLSSSAAGAATASGVSASAASASAAPSYATTVGLKLGPASYPPKENGDLVSSAFAKSPAIALSERELTKLYTYKVPKLGADGQCSATHEMEKEPFDLRSVYGLTAVPFAGSADASASNSLAAHAQSLRLWRLNAVVQTLASLTKCEWLGVYTAYALPR
jgi:hypothetical protein